MPNYWESAHGLSNEEQDHNGTGLSNTITGINGYTNLECYINCLSDFLVSGQSSFACGITGVASLSSISSKHDEFVFIYPNPSKGVFTVLMPKLSEEIKVYNAVGQVVYQTKNNGQTSLDLDIIENGIYTVQVSIENEVIIKKVVVCK